ncbi:MAG: glycosyltransferase family 2 protein [Acidobacteria bacterium]|nr:glycosyltransferase family 2 protein [Acidobacteriota bacterium]
MRNVSIIIPCYNGGRYLREAINSAMEQTYSRKQIVVVDDGSTDNSPNILKEYIPDIKIITQRNSGQPKARNSGVKASNGDFLAFLDCDDWWDKTFLEKMMDSIEDEETIGYCGWQNVGLPDGKGRPYIPPDYEENGSKIETLLRQNIWPIHAAVVSRKKFDETGGFNPEWTSGEDYDFWLRTAIKSKIVLVPEVLAFYRHHASTQITKNRFLIAKNHWLIQKDFLKREKILAAKLGRKKISVLTKGELKRTGFVCYWAGDLENARKIFRFALLKGCLHFKDLKYALPAFFPYKIHRFLLKFFR